MASPPEGQSFVSDDHRWRIVDPSLPKAYLARRSAALHQECTFNSVNGYDAGAVFREHPDNVCVIKASYWIGRENDGISRGDAADAESPGASPRPGISA